MHTYLQLVLERFDCYGTWLPGSRIQVGEIGRIVGGGSFDLTGDIEGRTQEPAPPTIRIKEPPRQATAGATASREAGISLAAGEILDAIAKASASVQVKMDRRNSAVLILEEVTRRQFSDERTIRALMEAMQQRGLIELDEVLVTYVLEAQSGVVAASSSKETGGGSELELGLTEFELGKVEGRLAITSGETSDTLVEATKGRPLTPMYRVLFFRGSRNWWNFWKKHYTIEALLQSAASLRAHRRTRGYAARVTGPGYGGISRFVGGTRALVPMIGEPELPGVVSSSMPSLSLAEVALQDLGEAGLETEAVKPLLSFPEIEPLAEFAPETPAMVTVHNNLGDVLQAQGDLEGARHQYERAIEWLRATSTGRLPHEAEASFEEEIRRESSSAEAEADE